ncbi:MAG: hypothetical protein JSW05_05095 [Candidatus Thorarchaeota archaeon]|nr:MAG: hypothetical protein JSW05_05095 [Candidatus Thorarchaeota archaeon]
MEEEMDTGGSDVGSARLIERTLAALLVFISVMYLVLGSYEHGIYNLLALPLEIAIAALGLWVWGRSGNRSMSDADNYPPELLLNCPYCGATYQYGESSVLPEQAVQCQNCTTTILIQ